MFDNPNNFYNKFYESDMAQANGEAALARIPLNEATGEEFTTCKYAFFPGCQLGAAEPEIVIKIYDSLRFQHPDTAIFLQCCGIPAESEGDTEYFRKNIEDIRSKWKSLGKPTMVMACMTCYKKFKEYLPEIPLTSLYELLLNLKISGGCNSEDYSLFSSYNAKDEDKAYNAVKELAEDMGVKLHPFDENEEYPYITYCINCRDIIKTQGKDAVHILELIYGMGASNTHMIHDDEHHHDPDEDLETPEEISEENCDGNCSLCSSCSSCDSSGPAPLPTMAERWQNRLELKQFLLDLFWDEPMDI